MFTLRINHFYIFLLLIITLVTYKCENSQNQITEGQSSPENKMYVYNNTGNTFYVIDYLDFKVKKTINLPLPKEIDYCIFMTISSDRRYLILAGYGTDTPPSLYFVTYDIEKEKLYNYFYSGLQFDGPPRFESANIPSDPGLFYLYHRGSGLYSFDFLKQKQIRLISDDHDFSMEKFIYHSPFSNQTIIEKDLYGQGYSELYLFDTDSYLSEVNAILNFQDQDSIALSDLSFSKDKNIVYTSFKKSKGTSREIACYFGYYDLEKKEFNLAPFELPWSLTPYYMTYSQKNQQVYLMGGSSRFYIINVQNFTIEQTLTIPNKAGGPSRIVLSPDENFAFVSCSNSDFVAVIDLEKPGYLTKIDVPHPYRMIIP